MPRILFVNALVCLLVAACSSTTDGSEGASCSIGGSCVHSPPPQDCSAGLVCVGKSGCLGGSGVGTCRRPVALGEKCGSDAPCAAPTACAQVGPAAGTCAAAEEVVLGESCDPQRLCGAGLRCVSSVNPTTGDATFAVAGRCAAEGTEPGAACGDATHVCDSRAVPVHCDMEKKVCAARAPAGGFCVIDFDCAGSNCRDGHCA
jgi:hypothetical protein